MAIDTVGNPTSGLVLAASTITLTGSIFGVSYEALMWGMVGGLMSLMWLEPKNPEAVKTPLSVFALVATSAILGGVFSPFLTSFLLDQAPSLKSLTSALKVASPLAIGLLWHTAMPAVMDFVKAKISGVGK